MHYRAQGLDWISRIGYAVSEDGVNWNRLRDPVLEPEGDREARGVEDPRVTEIDGVFYMAYTAFSGKESMDEAHFGFDSGLSRLGVVICCYFLSRIAF